MTIWFMLVAAVLHLFNVDKLAVAGINEITNGSYTTSVYWLMFLVCGLVLDVISMLVKIFS